MCDDATIPWWASEPIAAQKLHESSPTQGMCHRHLNGLIDKELTLSDSRDSSVVARTYVDRPK
jgi:hypothetical protein